MVRKLSWGVLFGLRVPPGLAGAASPRRLPPFDRTGGRAADLRQLQSPTAAPAPPRAHHHRSASTASASPREQRRRPVDLLPELQPEARAAPTPPPLAACRSEIPTAADPDPTPSLPSLQRPTVRNPRPDDPRSAIRAPAPSPLLCPRRQSASTDPWNNPESETDKATGFGSSIPSNTRCARIEKKTSSYSRLSLCCQVGILGKTADRTDRSTRQKSNAVRKGKSAGSVVLTRAPPRPRRSTAPPPSQLPDRRPSHRTPERLYRCFAPPVTAAKLEPPFVSERATVSARHRRFASSTSAAASTRRAAHHRDSQPAIRPSLCDAGHPVRTPPRPPRSATLPPATRRQPTPTLPGAEDQQPDATTQAAPPRRRPAARAYAALRSNTSSTPKYLRTRNRASHACDPATTPLRCPHPVRLVKPPLPDAIALHRRSVPRDTGAREATVSPAPHFRPGAPSCSALAASLSSRPTPLHAVAATARVRLASPAAVPSSNDATTAAAARSKLAALRRSSDDRAHRPRSPSQQQSHPTRGLSLHRGP
ncbi:mediator of DNA damage checkpoint protein 1-like [Eucalyptus grandis]|uniref:mediator of DNA damage checkpoint protein 1-like n=1 Tax=Eucalyptus grandis TaxID=71139 RepID=UPI00192ECFFC|nr:mediator of DNA damage checkpoint protein 1-like [Eucalyptus grandis]